jgi:hypothetical protein
LQTIQTNIAGYIDVLNGIPDAINTTVSTDYTSTGTPPPWAGGPSSGDVGENNGSWGGEQMASGGMVTGGVPGRDSVPAMLMPGEEVLSVNNPRNARNGGGSGMTFTGDITIVAAPGQNGEQLFNEFMRAAGKRSRLQRVGMG